MNRDSVFLIFVFVRVSNGIVFNCNVVKLVTAKANENVNKYYLTLWILPNHSCQLALIVLLLSEIILLM